MRNDLDRLKILICDDSAANVMILSKLLQSDGFTDVRTVTDPLHVYPILEREIADLILLDIEMPNMDGFAVMQQIAESHLARHMIPIMILTGRQGKDVRNRALQSGAQDFLNKPFDQTEVLLRVRNLLRVRQAYLDQCNLARDLERRIADRTRELEQATDILIERLAMAGEMRDTDTGRHVLRVGKYARVLAEAYGLPPDISYLIEKSAPLHDLGKIGIPDKILLKKGTLTKDEREHMDNHTRLGAELLSRHDSLLVQMASSIALSHHERWDGEGYPAKLKAESIPIEGRITAIADVFDALTTVRPYKDAWSIEHAANYIQQRGGSQFDPQLTKLFMENIDKIIDIRTSHADIRGI